MVKTILIDDGQRKRRNLSEDFCSEGLTPGQRRYLCFCFSFNSSAKLNSFFNSSNSDFAKLVAPKTSLERELLAHPEFRRGYSWGRPRFGHPEGLVGLHVLEVLDNIARLPADKNDIEALRLLAITHDTFKYLEFERLKNGAARLHHGLLARQFLKDYICDRRLLTIIERHDEAYHIWRIHHLKGNPESARQRMDTLVKELNADLPLYWAFFKCDSQTGDKLQAPVFWFYQELEKRGVPF